jgi:ABC-type multidrug transport system fused ATPase/permease subunit
MRDHFILYPAFDTKMICVIILITVQAFLDIATVMFVGYSLSVFINGAETLGQIKILSLLKYHSINITSFEDILKIAIFLILFRSIFTAVANYFSLKVAANIGISLRQEITSYYVESDYAKVKNIPMNVLQRNMVDLVNLYVGKIVQPTMKILSDGLIVIGLLFVVFFSSNAVVLLSLCLLMGLILLIDRVFKKLQEKNGALNVHAIGLLHALVKDVACFAAEIRVSNYNNYIRNREMSGSTLFASSWRNSVFWISLSRLILETLAYLFLILLLWHISTTNIESIAIIGMLVTFARAIPIFNSIATNLAMLRNGAPIVQELSKITTGHQDSVRIGSDELRQQAPGIAMSVQNLIYGIDTPLNTSPLDFDLRFGEILGVVGPSGSGKTSLIEVLAGLRTPISGNVTLRPLSQLSLLTQTSNILYDTLNRNLAPNNHVSADQINGLLARLKLSKIIDRYSLDSKHIINANDLSGGQVQRLNILRSMLQPKEIWILDEPSNALDQDSKRLVMSLIQEEANKGIAVIIITHDVELMQLCQTQIKIGD